MPSLLRAESAWLEHAPFAFWLIDALRPRQIVELGCYTGFSYAVFCQAVQSLGVDSRCHAVDTWLGDEHTGFYGPDVFETVNAYNDAHYGAFSRLIRSDFREALRHFPQASIDLLHIDGRHTYEDVKSDYNDWRSRMSDRGVILFHDTNEHERDFGVARFWPEVSREHRSFEFLHGHGLGIVGVGKTLPPALEFLFRSVSDPPLVHQIRQTYSRLGRSVADGTLRPMLEAKIRELEVRPTADPAEREQAARLAAEREYAAKIAETERVNAAALAESERVSAAVIAESERAHVAALAEAERVHAATLAETEREHAARLARSEQEHSIWMADTERAHTVRMTKLESELARQVRRQNFLAAVASQRNAEIEAAAQQLVAAQAELAAVRAEKEQLQARNAEEMQATVTAYHEHSENLQRQLASLYRSTSWRITRPLRGIARALRVNS